MLVDTHVHLQWASFDGDRDQVIRKAREAGVEIMIVVGFDIESSTRAIELADKYRDLYATVGIHPHSADQWDEKASDVLTKLCENPKVIAIGEIGLDYYRNLADRETQKRAFDAQLYLASQLAMPVIVHDRDAHSEILNMLRRFKGEITGVMHFFSGDRRMADHCTKLGFYLSFAGPITFSNSVGQHDIAKSTRLDRILLETDSPWLSPQEMRGKRNEPANLPLIAERVSQLRRLSLDKLASNTTENAKRLFRLS